MTTYIGKPPCLCGEPPSVLLIHAAGMGMSGLARILLSYKWRVFGWDDGDYPQLRSLCDMGLMPCEEKALPKVDYVIHSELMQRQEAASRFNCASSAVIFSMYEFIDRFISNSQSIGVVGSYGKTTVVAMLSGILDVAGLRPNVLAGGTIRRLGSNASLGASNLWVVEIPEARGQVACMSCTIGIILNIESRGLLYNCNAFRRKIREKILVNGDDKLANQWRKDKKAVYYGFEEAYCYTASMLSITERSLVMLCRVRGKAIGVVRVPIFGEFNKYNALAAVALGIEMGVAFKYIQQGLAEYAGVEKRGEVLFRGDKHCLIVDIAHHPQAITSILAAGASCGFEQLVVVYHPHMYEEISDGASSLVKAFAVADRVLVTDVHSIKDRKRAHEEDGVDKFVYFANCRSSRTRWAHSASVETIVDHLPPVLRCKTLVFQLGMYIDGNITQSLLQWISEK